MCLHTFDVGPLVPSEQGCACSLYLKFACREWWGLSGCVFSFSRGEDENRKGIYAQAWALFADLVVGGQCARVYLAYARGRNNSSCSSSNWNAIRRPIAIYLQEKASGKSRPEMVEKSPDIALKTSS
jgi:hypothetical protein